MRSWTDFVRVQGVVMASVVDTLAELRQRRDQLRERLTRIERAIRALEAVSDPVPDSDLEADLFAAWESPSTTRRRRSPGVSPNEIADAVEQLLKERGQPMTRGQIAKALEERGLRLAGANVNKNIGTILWRHRNRFVNLEKLGYWLVAVALPGVYAPPR